MADVPFTTYAFPTADGSANRTLPARLSDVANVRDYGATGNGVTDDWAAITAAFNHGQVILVATAPNVGSVITFASVPATITTFMFATDVTNPSALDAPANPRVNGTSGTTVTLAFIVADGDIQAGDIIAFNISLKGTIFFPPGTYKVSQSIVMSGSGFNVLGVGVASTITGNFSDYVFRRQDADIIESATLSSIENLKVINTHATGGGILMGSQTKGAVRDCIVVANQGIQIASDRTPTPASGPLDMSVENCNVSPGSNTSGSIGIMSLANGPIFNCKIVGYESGMRLYGNEGNQDVLGCYFEGNLVALELGIAADGSNSNSGGLFVSGSWFKNNGTAIKIVNGIGSGRFTGLRIEASEAVTVYGARPQYGIQIGADKNNLCLFAGITITGQYDQYGVLFAQDIYISDTWMGVQVANTSTHGGLTWGLPASPTSLTTKFIGCNVSPVFTVAQLFASSFEGDSYNVSDSNSSTWGATAGGSGSTHAKVRWNGSAWTVVGK